MKRISCLCILCLALARLSKAQPIPSASSSSAAEVAARQAAQEDYQALRGHVDDLLAAQADTEKRIQSLVKDIADLREQAAKPSAAPTVTQEDLKRLADAIQEIDKKREADKELILKEISKLGRSIGSAPLKPSRSALPESERVTPAASNPDQPGYYYLVKKGDNYHLIALAYSEQGIKVTAEEIEKANPGINPSKLKIGQKIFIPAK